MRKSQFFLYKWVWLIYFNQTATVKISDYVLNT